MNPKLSLRLSTIADLIPSCNGLADIGSDHCLLPIALASRDDILFLQAIDNKKGPYLTMEKAVREAGLTERISLSLSNGLDCLDERVDTLVLAGMGGKLISEILTRGSYALPHVERIVLDAHRDIKFIREFVLSLGFTIEDERLIEEGGLYYSIILFKKGEHPNYSDADMLFGPVIRRRGGEVYTAYLLENKKRIQGILLKDVSLNDRRRYNALLEIINAELANPYRPRR